MASSHVCQNFESLRQQQGSHKLGACGCCQLAPRNRPSQSQNKSMPSEMTSFFTDQQKDICIMKEFKPDSLTRSGIDAAFRAHLFGWMLRVQVYIGIPSEILHLGSLYVDRYLWRKATSPAECNILTGAALWVAIKTATAQLCLDPDLICSLAKNSFSKEQLLCMELDLLKVLDFRLICPTPYSYLEIFLQICNDIPPFCTRLVNLACSYILELGLMEYKLTQFPAFLRCLAVIYLIRRILRVNGGILQGGCTNVSVEDFHEFSLLPLVPKELEILTGYSEESNLPSIAFIYGTLVQKAKEFLSPSSKYPITLLPVFEKYNTEHKDRIAIHPIMKSFELKVIFEDFLQRNDQPICGRKQNGYYSEYNPAHSEEEYDDDQDFDEDEFDEEFSLNDWQGEHDGGYDINEPASLGSNGEEETAVALTLYGHFLHEDLFADLMWTSRRRFGFLEEGEPNENMRALLVDWMMKVQQCAGFPTHFLFMAVELLDYYTNLSVIPLYEYQLVACAAQKMVLDQKPQFALAGAEFLIVTENAYTLQQLQNMEIQVQRVVGLYQYTPNPYNYLSVCFRYFERLGRPLSRAECFLMCRYILELGLTESRLVPYPAIFRCCGAIYLLRRIIQHQLIAQYPANRDRIVGAFPLWPRDLELFTGVEEYHHLKIIAYYYGRQLYANRQLLRQVHLPGPPRFLVCLMG
ncbi:G2/mitotic-specific cyclin cdc13 [Taenia solium]|eukprot:TsM_000219300 transcript=TsM_000219300 gene=TsM_000219300